MNPKNWKELTPSLPSEPLISRGTVQYCERKGGRTVINIRKEIQREFKDLQDRKAKIHYTIEFHRKPDTFKRRVHEILQKRRLPPFLLSLFKGEAPREAT